MKYKTGDKVRYDSGDWLFNGVVTAIIENPICPSYRLSVDRMMKKNCKFSITQFEFELEAADEDIVDNDNLKWKRFEMEYLKKYSADQAKEELPQATKLEPKPAPIQVSEPVIIPEPEPEPEPETEPEIISEPEPMSEAVWEPESEITEPVQSAKQEPPRRRRNEAWDRNLEAYLKGDRSHVIHVWVSHNRKQYQTGKLKEEQLEKLIEIDFPFDAKRKKTIDSTEEQAPASPKEITKIRKIGDAWNKNFELYKSGAKSISINNWVGDIRRQYKAGKLNEQKIELLKEINFSFDARQPKTKDTTQVPQKAQKPSTWEKKLESFKNGEISAQMYKWINQNRKLYQAGKLKADQIEKLMEVNFPFVTRNPSSNE